MKSNLFIDMISERLRKWLPNPTAGAWLQLVPLVIMLGIFWKTAFVVFDLKVNTVKFWEYFIYGFIYSATAYWVGLAICLRLFGSRKLAAAFACFYLFLYGVNVAFLHHAGTVLQPFYLWIADGNNWTIYLTRWVWFLVAGLVAVCVLAVVLIHWQAAAMRALRLRGLILLLALLFVAPILRDKELFTPTRIAVAAVGAPQAGVWRTTQTFQLRSLADNPLVALVKALTHLPRPIKAYPESELAARSQVIADWHLPLGARDYPPLNLKPFNRILVFANESTSLDFMGGYNPRLPEELTPFYSSPAMRQRMFTNYKTVSLPTQPGLEVTYNSHPNAGGLLAGEGELSLIRLLNAQGFETYFLSSASESFNNNAAIFKHMGFKHVMGMETWRKDSRHQPYIEGWGLMDRILFQAALELLKTNQNPKIYIHVAGADTHNPFPREGYGSLNYPPAPAGLLDLIGNAQARTIMNGIFRHDYDLGLTMQSLQQQGLLTDDTLVVITADHNYPQAEVLNRIPGYPLTPYTRIPLAFFSGQELPPVDLTQLHSQLDFAPTMAHLLGLPVHEGWWGESIFATNRTAPRIAEAVGNLEVETSAGQQMLSLEHPKNASEAGLFELFHSIFTNALPDGPASASPQPVKPPE